MRIQTFLMGCASTGLAIAAATVVASAAYQRVETEGGQLSNDPVADHCAGSLAIAQSSAGQRQREAILFTEASCTPTPDPSPGE